MLQVGIEPAPEDTLHTVCGVEVVYLRKVDFLEMRESKVVDFEIEVGGMDYGFEIDGILGMDYLKASGAIVDCHEMQISFMNE